MAVAFGELRGELKPASSLVIGPPTTTVVLSSITHGSACSAGRKGLTLRYVGRGTEHYSIAGRYHRLDEDQLMIAPQALGAEVEVRRGNGTTLGLCIFLPTTPDDCGDLIDAPIVLPASCGFGDVLRESLRRLNAPNRDPSELELIARQASTQLAATIDELERQVELVSGLKRRTRFESVRRMNVARAYLHHVTDRAVPLDELARETAVSPFQLLRSFRDCFGETPAAYHRRLRLNLVREMVEESGLSYAFVADRFGFAGGASFSHAYRRTFGEPPVRRLVRAAPG